MSHGLRPQSKIFDWVFGWEDYDTASKVLRKAITLGPEISKERHRIATEWLELGGLGNSEAQLILALDNEFEFIKIVH